MTAGERKCYEAVQQCLESYGWDDLLFGVSESIRQLASDEQEAEHKELLGDALGDIADARDLLGQLPAAPGPDSGYVSRNVTWACGHESVIYYPPDQEEKFVGGARQDLCRACRRKPK